jgi:hypothetical protein
VEVQVSTNIKTKTINLKRKVLTSGSFPLPFSSTLLFIDGQLLTQSMFAKDYCACCLANQTRVDLASVYYIKSQIAA